MSSTTGIQATDVATNRKSKRIQVRIFPLIWFGLGVLAAVLLWLSTPYGVALSNTDPVNYIKSAQSLAQGFGYLEFDGSPLVRWPPLFPSLISLPVLVGVDAGTSLRLLNALTFGGVVMVTGLLLRSLLHSTPLVVLGAVAVMSSWSLFLAAYLGFSEVLFTLLLLAFWVVFPRYQKQTDLRNVLLLVLIAALANLTRYLGVTLTAAGSIAILLLTDQPVKRRLWVSLVFGILAVLPVALWFGRNYALTGSIAGGGWANQDAVLHLIPDALVGWLLAGAEVRLTADPTVGVLLTLIVALVLALLAWSLGDRKRVQPLVLFVPVYIAVFMLLASQLNVAVNARMLAPLYPFVIALALVSLDGLAQRVDNWQHSRYNIGRLTAVALLCFWLVAPVSKLYREVMLLSQDDSALFFNNRRWQEAELLAWLQVHPPTQVVTSNAAFSVAALTPFHARMMPKTLDGWGGFEGDVVLVWFGDVEQFGCWSSNAYCYAPQYTVGELAQHVNLTPLVENDEGGVYRVQRKNDGNGAA